MLVQQYEKDISGRRSRFRADKSYRSGAIIYADVMPPVRGTAECVVSASEFDRASQNPLRSRSYKAPQGDLRGLLSFLLFRDPTSCRSSLSPAGFTSTVQLASTTPP